MNIQRYKIADMAHLHPDKDGEICMFKDVDLYVRRKTKRTRKRNRNLKASISEQAKEIESLTATLEVREQSLGIISRLKNKAEELLKDAYEKIEELTK